MRRSQNYNRTDLATLRKVIRGPGTYATPSQDRINRLIQQGLVKRVKGALRPTLKGRIVAWFNSRERSEPVNGS